MIKKLIFNSILNDIREALKKNNAYLHNPYFDFADKKLIENCINSSFVSSAGKEISKFEKSIANYTNSKYAIATVNGTSALHISLLALGTKENYEILVPSLSFIAPINAVLYCKAIPHFIDIDEETLGFNVKKLDSYLGENTYLKKNRYYNKKTHNLIFGMIPVHLFGHPSDVVELKKIAKKYKLFILEDAAEALGSFYKNKHVGTFGDIGIFSFNGNKIITTGGGGVVVTNNKNIASKIRHISSTAKINHPWDYIHDQIGYNYRMPNLNAALGISQLAKLKKYLKRKRLLNKKYNKVFSDNQYVEIFNEPPNSKSNYWFQNILIKKKYKIYKDSIIEYLNNNGIQCRPAWSLVHKLEYCKKFPRMNLSKTKELYERIISIPSNPEL